MRPLQHRHIGDVSQLLVSPDGALNLVPFEALVDEQGRYLIERFSISYLTSGRDLLRMQVPRVHRSRARSSSRTLDYGEPAPAAAGSWRRKQPSPRAQHRSVTTAVDRLGVVLRAAGEYGGRGPRHQTPLP